MMIKYTAIIKPNNKVYWTTVFIILVFYSLKISDAIDILPFRFKYKWHFETLLFQSKW